MLPLLVALVMPGAFGSVTLESPGGGAQLDLPTVEAMTLTASPSDGPAQMKTWKGEEAVGGKKLSCTIRAAMPGITDANRRLFDQSVEGMEKEAQRDGGDSLIVERNGFKVRLSARYFTGGGVFFVESARGPIPYYRAIVAEKGQEERAKEMLLGATFRDNGSGWRKVYESGFPTGWTYSFAGIDISIPRPQAFEKLTAEKTRDGIDGTVYYTFYGDGGASSWGVSDLYGAKRETVEELARRPLPRAVDYSPSPRIARVDVVEWRGQKLLRQSGVYGNGQFERDWMSFTLRDGNLRLYTASLTKDKKAAWPATPFPVEAVGTPLKGEIWAMPAGTYARTIDLGGEAKFSYTLYGAYAPEAKDDVFTLSDEAYLKAEVFVRSAARKTTDGLNLDGGRFVAKAHDRADYRKPIDYQWKREGKSWWVSLRWLGGDNQRKPTVYREEIVGTEQGGEPFVMRLWAVDTDLNASMFRDAVLSCKGADGQPLFKEYPAGTIGAEYILPLHKQRFPMTPSVSTIAARLGEGNLLLSGYPLPDGVRVVPSLNVTHEDGAKLFPHIGLVLGALFPDTKPSSDKKFKLTRGGKELVQRVRREYKNRQGKDVVVTAFELEPGAYITIVQQKGQPESWRTTLGLDKP
ncbi:hypothetical protein [Armatimonas sp.]|uniref:hypothetical protein n=1 Tax=Armatimonas sp. TaxID=1872638 RepID=UPI00374D3FEE